jgi:hypothetical protein
VYYLVRDSIVALAAFGGGLLWMHRPEANFLTAFGCGAVGTLWFALRGGRAQITRDTRAPRAAESGPASHSS